MFEKLRLVTCVCVVGYRPHRTKKGHYVWRRHRIVGGPYATNEQVVKDGHGDAPLGSIHNLPLTEEETIKAIAGDEKP